MSTFKFTPTSDITPLELAKIFNIMVSSLIQAVKGEVPDGKDVIEIDENIYHNVPDDLKKYFRLNENE